MVNQKKAGSAAFRYAVISVISVVLALLICFYAVPANVAAEEEEQTDPRGVSTVLLDSIMLNRWYVVQTLTGSSPSANNPIANEYAYLSKYKFKEIAEKYEQNDVLRIAVDIYRTINDVGDEIMEIPSALLDYFLTDESWTNFINGARNKTYDSLLSAFFTSDYESVSGMTLCSELSSIADLKVREKTLKTIKEKIKAATDLSGLISDVNSVFQYKYLYDYLPEYAISLDTYLTRLKGKYKLGDTYDNYSQNELLDVFRMMSFENEQIDDETLAKWKFSTDLELLCDKFEKPAKDYLLNALDFVQGTVSHAMLFEHMAEEKDSLAVTLRKIRQAAEDTEDLGFARVVGKYINVLESDFTDNEACEIFAATAESLIDIAEKYMTKWVGKNLSISSLSKKYVKHRWATALKSQNYAMTTAYVKNYVFISELSTALQVWAFIANNLTGIDQVCEKIYQLDKLNNIRDYAIDVFWNDYYDYLMLQGRSGVKDEEYYDEREEVASAVIDDLTVVKRITLLGEQTAYDMLTAATDSVAGQLIEALGDLIFDYTWSDDIEDQKNRAISTLVDTLIDPLAAAPVNVSSNQRLEVNSTADGYISFFYEGEQQQRVAGMSDRLNAGVALDGGTLKISNYTNTPVYVKYIAASGDSKLIVEGNGQVIIGCIDSDGTLEIRNNSSSELRVLTDVNVSGYYSTINANGTIHIEGDLCGDGYYSVTLSGGKYIIDGTIYNGTSGLNLSNDTIVTINESFNYDSFIQGINILDGRLIINGDLYARKINMLSEDAYLLVNGDFTLEHYRDSNGWYVENSTLEAGTVELKGDFKVIDGYYTEKENHKTIFSGDGKQSVSVIGTLNPLFVNHNIAGSLDEVNLLENTVIQSDALSIGTLYTKGNTIAADAGELSIGILHIDDGAEFISTNTTQIGTIEATGSSVINCDIQAGNIELLDADILTVNGNCECSSIFTGVYLSSGRLNINGNLYARKLQMYGGYLLVNGDFTLEHYRDSNGWYVENSTLEAGTVELKGDFKVIDGSYTEKENHKTVFSGDETQRIEISVWSTLNAIFENRYIEGSLDGCTLNLLADEELEGDSLYIYELHMNGHSLIMDIDELSIYTLEMDDGSKIENERISVGYIVSVAGKADINGDFESINIYLTDGKLNVYGNLYTRYLSMESEDDYLLVTGDFTLDRGQYGTTSDLKAGTVEVKGDFTLPYYSYYYEADDHKTVFSGDETQRIEISDGGTLNVIFKNRYIEGSLDGCTLNLLADEELEGESLYIYELHTNGHKLIADIEEFSLYVLEIDDGAELKNGIITINYKITATGDSSIDAVIQGAPYVYISEGALSVNGDCEVGPLYFTSGQLSVNGNLYTRYLSMESEDDYLLVTGDFTLDCGQYGTTSNLKAGTVEVKGDFTLPYYSNYYEAADHKTVFSGDETQRIEISCWSTLNVIFENRYIEGSLDSCTLNLLADAELEGDSLYIYELHMNGHSLIMDIDELSIYTLEMDDGSKIENERISVGYNVSVAGKADINGDFESVYIYLTDGKLNVYGNLYTRYLSMESEDDYLFVTGDFTLDRGQYGTTSNLKAGTVEVKGDFTLPYYGYYYEADDHKTIFSGDETQRIEISEWSTLNAIFENRYIEGSLVNCTLNLLADAELEGDSLYIYELHTNGNDFIYYGELYTDVCDEDLAGIVIFVECGKMTVFSEAERYSIDGRFWQTYNEFYGLADGEYTVYLDGAERSISFTGHKHEWTEVQEDGDVRYFCVHCKQYRDEVLFCVRFMDYDGRMISEEDYSYGATVEVPEDPVRPDEGDVVFTFAGWGKEITPCLDHATYIAVYTTEEEVFTVTFSDWDGKVISEATYHYGDTVAVPADPARPADETYTYTFSGWTPAVAAVSGNAAYTATYKAEEKPIVPQTETVEIRLDTVNGHEEGQSSILVPSDGKNTPESITAYTETLGFMLGDVNGNGKIDAADYAMTKRHYLNTFKLNAEQLDRADVNRSGKVEASEYAMIKRHYLNTYVIKQPEPKEIPGFDYSDFAVFTVNAGGEITIIDMSIGSSKAGISIPDGGYAIAIHKSVIASSPEIAGMLSGLAAGDPAELGGTSVAALAGAGNGSPAENVSVTVTYTK